MKQKLKWSNVTVMKHQQESTQHVSLLFEVQPTFVMNLIRWQLCYKIQI